MKSFWKDTRGNIALMAAFGLPALLLAVVTSVELYSLSVDRQRLRDVADATALAAENQLGQCRLVARSGGVRHRAA